MLDGIGPAAKWIAVLAAGTVVATTPGWRPVTLAAFGSLSGILLIVFAPPKRMVAKRLPAVSPVVVLSGAARVWQTGDGAAEAAVAAKTGLHVLLFVVLTAATPVSALLQARRRMGMPKAMRSVLTLMERSVHRMGEELRRMRRAPASRTVHAMGAGQRFRRGGQRFGALLLRSWNRSDRVYHATLARGFTGDWPGGKPQGLAAARSGFPGGDGGGFRVGALDLTPAAEGERQG